MDEHPTCHNAGHFPSMGSNNTGTRKKLVNIIAALQLDNEQIQQ